MAKAISHLQDIFMKQYCIYKTQSSLCNTMFITQIVHNEISDYFPPPLSHYILFKLNCCYKIYITDYFPFKVAKDFAPIALVHYSLLCSLKL